MDFNPVILPQSSPNDEFAVISKWLKSSGDYVSAGEILCTAETTKSVFEVECQISGYLFILAGSSQEARIGDTIAVISSEPASQEVLDNWLDSSTKEFDRQEIHNKEIQWTLKAKLLAEKYGLDIHSFPFDKEKITEADIEAFIAQKEKSQTPLIPKVDFVDDNFPSNRIQRVLIIGGGDGAVQVLDVLNKIPEKRGVAILDDDRGKHGKRIAGIPIVGAIHPDWIEEKFHEGEFDAAVISISTIIDLRAQLFEQLQARSVPFTNIIHPTVEIGMNVNFGSGNIILTFCHIGSCTKIGNNNFLSAYCSIEHHNELGDHCSFGPGIITSSRVIIGDCVRFGTGIFVEPKLSIGSNSVIGSGVAITKNISEEVVVKPKLTFVERPR